MNTPLRFFPRVIFALIGAGIVTVLIAPILIITSWFSKDDSVYRLTQLWAWFNAKFQGVRYTVVGTEHIEPGRSYIITPNHQSHTDILALLLGLPVKYRWVIKKELLKVPVFGYALSKTGAISIDRSNKQEAVKSLVEAKDKLKDGWSVLIYPEGTRTPDGNIHEFKKGAFMMAVLMGIPILPVTCNGAYKILPKKTVALSPGCVQVVIGRPIEVEGLTENEVPQLMQQTRETVLANFNPNYDPFSK